MSLYDDLLDVFAAHPISAIVADNGRLLRDRFNARSIEDLNARPEYRDSFNTIADAKRVLEGALHSCNGNSSLEISKCLSQIVSFNDNGHNRASDAFLALIKKSLYREWSEDKRLVFDRKYSLIIDWKHFFLSYTNRDYFATYNSFKNLIDSNLAPGVRRAALRAEANALAHLIAQLLEQTGMRGFFDAKMIKSGDDIQDEIKTHCKTAYTFIQLMEHITFTDPPAGLRNWCFEEYNEFAGETEMMALSGCPHDKRYHFVLTVDAIANLIPQFCNRQYSEWIAHASRLNVKSIEDGRRLDSLRESIREIATQIKTLRDAVIFNTLQR